MTAAAPFGDLSHNIFTVFGRIIIQRFQNDILATVNSLGNRKIVIVEFMINGYKFIPAAFNNLVNPALIVPVTMPAPKNTEGYSIAVTGIFEIICIDKNLLFVRCVNMGKAPGMNIRSSNNVGGFFRQTVEISLVLKQFPFTMQLFYTVTKDRVID